MTKIKPSKKFIKISVIIVVCLMVFNFLLSGINMVPYKYRDKPVSFLTQNLTWDSKPSDIILIYGLPKDFGEVNDITGERDFDFNFVYDEKAVSLSVDNRNFLNNEIHRYYFTIDCKTPEEASAFFDECHIKIMDLYKDEPDFDFSGTNKETEYAYSDGTPCDCLISYENGQEKVLVIDENLNEVPIEEADNIIQTEKKENNYKMFSTTGIFYSLIHSDGESCVTLRAEIMY